MLLHSHTESAQYLPLASEFLVARRFLPTASGDFLAARRFLPPDCPSWVLCACSCIHTHNQRNLYRWASEFLAARRFLPPGCPSWVPCACSCIHTQNQRNFYWWHPNSWRPDASCRRADHRGCRALESAFSHTESAQSAQSLLLASLCARASVNLPPAQKDRSLTSATLRFR